MGAFNKSCTPALQLVLVWVICFPSLLPPIFHNLVLEGSLRCQHSAACFPELSEGWSPTSWWFLSCLLSLTCLSQFWAVLTSKGQCRVRINSFRCNHEHRAGVTQVKPEMSDDGWKLAMNTFMHELRTGIFQAR